jgi:cell division protein FtsB
VTQRQKIVLIVVGVAMGCLLLLVVFGDNGLLELRRLNTTHADLVEVNNGLTQANVHLNRAIDRLQHDPAFVEALARRELGMIRSDELIFQFKSGNLNPMPLKSEP